MITGALIGPVKSLEDIEDQVSNKACEIEKRGGVLRKVHVRMWSG